MFCEGVDAVLGDGCCEGTMLCQPALPCRGIQGQFWPSCGGACSPAMLGCCHFCKHHVVTPRAAWKKRLERPLGIPASL